jgi:hypothetical protein
MASYASLKTFFRCLPNGLSYKMAIRRSSPRSSTSALPTIGGARPVNDTIAAFEFLAVQRRHLAEIAF